MACLKNVHVYMESQTPDTQCLERHLVQLCRLLTAIRRVGQIRRCVAKLVNYYTNQVCIPSNTHHFTVDTSDGDMIGSVSLCCMADTYLPMPTSLPGY